MKLVDRIFADSSNDSVGERPVYQYYIVGNNIKDAPLEESMFILRHGPDADGEEWRWRFVKVNTGLSIPADTTAQICVHRKGNVVTIKSQPYQTHSAWLLSEAELSQLSNKNNIIKKIPFPERLRGETVPVGTNLDDEQLESLLLPLYELG